MAVTKIVADHLTMSARHLVVAMAEGGAPSLQNVKRIMEAAQTVVGTALPLQSDTTKMQLIDRIVRSILKEGA